MTEDDKIFWNFFVAVTDEFPIMNWNPKKKIILGHVLHLLLGKTFIFEGQNQHPTSPCNLGQSALRQSLSEPDQLGILQLPWGLSLSLAGSKPLEKSIIHCMVWSRGQFSSELQND